MLKFLNVIFYIFDFRQDLTCDHDSYTHTERHDKTVAIGKIADLPKKSQICLKRAISVRGAYMHKHQKLL